MPRHAGAGRPHSPVFMEVVVFDSFLYGVCYYPEHWPRDWHKRDLEAIRESGFNFIRIGEGAWSYWEPREGQYQFELFDQTLEICRRLDLKVVLGTPTYCGPAWIPQKYPSVLRWDINRQPMGHGSRRHFNYTSPDYLRLSDNICAALAAHYRDHPQVIGWQLDNELNCHMDVSYAPSDTAAFRIWLQKKYQSLENLNHAWGTRFWSQDYDSWDQIDLPGPTPAPPNPTQLLDMSRFISDTTVDFARRQAEILRRAQPKWQITTNGLFGNINGPDLSGVLDFFSHDQYPCFFNHWTEFSVPLITSRSLSFPYAVLEQQSGPGGQLSYFHRTPRAGEMRLWAWQSVAHGAAMLSFFRWRTCPYGAEEHWHGLIDFETRSSPRLDEARALGMELKSLPAEFLAAPAVRSVAVLRDYDNETNESRINTYAKQGNGEYAHWLRELGRRHIPADIVWPGDRLDGYSLIIAPHLRMMTRELVEQLIQAAGAGASIILGAQTATKDLNAHLAPSPGPGMLADLAGVQVEQWSTLAAGEQRGIHLPDGRKLPMHAFVERLAPTTAQILARWDGGDSLLADAPALTVRTIGKAGIYYIGGYAPPETIASLVQLLIDRKLIEPVVTASADIEVVARRGNQQDYLIILNHGKAGQRIAGLDGAVDIINGHRVIEGDLLLAGLGVAVVQRKR